MDKRGSSQGPSSYASQFTDSNSLILDRLHKATAKQRPNPLPTSTTLAMPQKKRPQSALTPSSPSSTLKRKRVSGPAVDFSQNTVPWPSPRQPPPSQQLRGADETAGKCCSCLEMLGGGKKKAGVVRCHVCRGACHQSCVEGRGSTLLCAECRLEQQGDSVERKLIEELRRKRLAGLPAGLVPSRPELVGFLPRMASEGERAEYFANKKTTDLVNVLALCGRLKPRLLVDVLVSISKKHPDLPLFDHPAWRKKLSGPPLAPGKEMKRPRGRPRGTTKHAIVPDASAAGVRSVSRGGSGVEAGQGRVVDSVSVAAAAPASASGSNAGEKDESLPPTWPQAGEGLYAKLPSEKEDGAFLVDDDDEEAFSHFMVDKVGKQIFVASCA
ncbi:hypothetical protein CDD80_5292 [Ophiocordyceps camponoti-rufipedis]|uniref:Zinc finger PHD-type domain-containing protein n=1 Tax=Ophiocordyceps camponoti-rufipedis TaxID=2004952 RepID=A0A2C5YVQ6_9HYPO|nr:hypothetical protein CDD80_5292 [Ophiocordyceps camponoti-rufipedis]